MDKFTYDITNYKKGQKKFGPDVNVGEWGEYDMSRFLQHKGFEFIEQTKGNDNRYDLVMGYKNNSYTYEIKTDVYEKDTGNIVIEFECKGKPSGINVTIADYFTTFFPFLGEVWNIKTSELRNLISNYELPIFGNKKEAGDPGSKTKLYVIEKKEFKHFFKVHYLK